MSTATTLTLDSIAEFQKFISARGRATNTVRAYGTDLRMLLTWSRRSSIPHKELVSVTMEWLNSTRAEASPKTTERRMTSIKAYSRWAKVKKAKSLSDYRLPSKQRTEPHPLPEGINGVRLMCQYALSDQDRALYALQGMCGLRVSEALAVEPGHVDVGQRMLKVRGKGDKERSIPISPEAWEQIEPAYHFALQNGGTVVRMADRTARDKITACGRRLRFERSISSHDLRATAATALYNKTRDIRMVQAFLGHSSVTTTQLYIGTSTSALREALTF